jgi:hypothetical protein
MQTETQPLFDWSTIGWTAAALVIVVALAVYFGMQ